MGTNYHAEFRHGRAHVGRFVAGSRFVFRGYGATELFRLIRHERIVRCLTQWEGVLRLVDFRRVVDDRGAAVPVEEFWRTVEATADGRDPVEVARGRFPREWHDGGGWPFRGEDFS